MILHASNLKIIQKGLSVLLGVIKVLITNTNYNDLKFPVFNSLNDVVDVLQ